MMRQKILLTVAFYLGFVPNLFAASDYQDLDRIFTQGDFQKVIQLTEAQIKKDPSDINAFYFGGRSYLRLNNYDKGMQLLLQFEKLYDAIELKQKKEIVKGKDQDCLLIDALYFPAYYLLGEYYVKNSNFRKAERNLRRAKSGYYNDRMLNFYLGLSSLELNKFDQAHKYFRRMIELDPQEASPYYNIAVTYAREGKTKEAIEWLREAIKRRRDYKNEASADKGFNSIRKTKEFQSLISQ